MYLCEKYGIPEYKCHHHNGQGASVVYNNDSIRNSIDLPTSGSKINQWQFIYRRFPNLWRLLGQAMAAGSGGSWKTRGRKRRRWNGNHYSIFQLLRGFFHSEGIRKRDPDSPEKRRENIQSVLIRNYFRFDCNQKNYYHYYYSPVPRKSLRLPRLRLLATFREFNCCLHPQE